jgi:hypothetical protein
MGTASDNCACCGSTYSLMVLCVLCGGDRECIRCRREDLRHLGAYTMYLGLRMTMLASIGRKDLATRSKSYTEG